MTSFTMINILSRIIYLQLLVSADSFVLTRKNNPNNLMHGSAIHKRYHVSTSTSIKATNQSSGDISKSFSEYMIKSHESKINAIREAEAKKNEEIKSLKKELQELYSSSSSVEEMHSKIVEYQTFIAKYMVKAQEEKYKAVKNAEKAVSDKYEAKMIFFLVPQTEATSTSKDSVVTIKSDNEPQSNSKQKGEIAATAANVRKSSSGAKEEVQKVSSHPPKKDEGSSEASKQGNNINDMSEILDVPTEVVADHDLRVDGDVVGLTLAERVSEGADASSAAAAFAPNALRGGGNSSPSLVSQNDDPCVEMMFAEEHDESLHTDLYSGKEATAVNALTEAEKEAKEQAEWDAMVAKKVD